MKRLLAILALGVASLGQEAKATTILAQGCINVQVPSGAGGYKAWDGPAAVGNGSADDTASINAALSAGNNIYFPPELTRLAGRLILAERPTSAATYLANQALDPLCFWLRTLD